MTKAKARCTALIAATFLAATAGSSQAVTLSLTPVSQTVPVGGTAVVQIVVSGLTGTGPLADLAAWAAQITYNSAIVTNTSNVFGTDLGFSFQTDLSSPGLIDLDEVSLESSAFFAAQPDSFVLATMSFDADAVGSTHLGFVFRPNPGGLPALSGPEADAIPFDVVEADIHVRAQSVPETMSVVPAAFAIGMVMVIGARLKKNSRSPTNA